MEWVEGQTARLREERGGNAKRAKTDIEMAGGKTRQVVCGGVCVSERVKVRNTDSKV